MSNNPDIMKNKAIQAGASVPGDAARLLSAPSSTRKRGSAIVIVLLLIFLLTVSVISFFLLVEDDRQRAHSFLDVIRAQIMIESASQEVIAKIMDGSEVPYTNVASSAYVQQSGTYKYMAQASMTAEPGLMEVRYYNTPPNRGSETGATAFTSTNAFFQNPFNSQYLTPSGTFAQANPQLIPLFSWKWYAPGIRYLKVAGGVVDTTGSPNPNYNPAVQFNINTSANPFYPGELYLSGIPSPTVAAKAAYYSTSTPPETSNFLPAPPAPGFQFQTGESSLDRPIFVQWIPIYANPTQPPGPKNQVIGRYAYWVDVENTKVNLNTSTRLFDGSPARAMEGQSEVDTQTSPYQYYVLGQTTTTASSATYERDTVEKKLWKSVSGSNNVNEVEADGTVNDGTNSAASTYFNLWFGWNAGGLSSDPQWSIPLAADNSTVDWRVFTGMRPYGTNGMGTNVSVEQLTTSYGTNIPTTGAFNTWLEAYSMLDPQVQINNSALGQLTLATMRRTHALSTTIYGYDDELDPLGRPKLDIVAFQNPAFPPGPGNAVAQELWSRLNDPNYHNAYYPNAFPNSGNSNSFVQSYNGFAGDLTTNNIANGQAVVNQMLVNIYSYGQPHTTPPSQALTGGLFGNGGAATNGVWPVKSMPYVAEVATRARSAMMLLPATSRVLSNFFAPSTNVVAGVTNITWASTNVNLTDTNGVPRSNFWYVTNVLVDLGVGFVNPNPFATNANVTTFTILAENGSFWTNTVTPDPTYTNGVVGFASSATDNLQGTYALRPTPSYTGSPFFGLRASGTNCYFNMGVVPSSIITNTNFGTALAIKGWTLTDAGGNIFDQAPMANLGQSGTPRSWWQMALTGNNAGPISHMTSLAWFRTGSIAISGSYSYPTFAPPYVNRAVGWFTPKTICEITNAGTNAVFPGLIYPVTTTYSGTNYGTTVATMTNIPANVFTNTNWGWYQCLTNQFTQCANIAMVERVQCVDPVIGHRTGNPANTITASTATVLTYLDKFNTPQQIQGATAGSTLAGHFYGVAGHPWRLYDNFAATGVVTTVAGTPVVTYATNPVTVMVQEPSGVGFITVPVTSNVVTATGTTGGGGTFTGTTILNPLSCLTKPFDNPNNTKFSQAEWDGYNIPQYGGFNPTSGNQGWGNFPGGEASVISSLSDGLYWPADLETSTGTYAGTPNSSPYTTGGNGWPFDQRYSPTGIRGSGNNGSTSAQATFSTPWGIVDSAPSGLPMTSIGELGFVHSGFIQHPINIGGVQYMKIGGYGGAPGATVLGSPENGPPMSMLLDLFTPHAFHNNATGGPVVTPMTEPNWALSGTQNTPSNPRRGTVNVNEGVASDNYMAIREGYSTTGAVHANPNSMAVRPAWVPTAMFFRNNPLATVNGNDESNLNNIDVNGGRLDSFMQPVPRYRRGWDSVISMIGGDFSTFREMGEGAWLGRGQTATDAGVGYMAIGSPLGTWKPGLGAYGGSVFSQFDTSTGYGGASELLTLGREASQSSGASTTRGYFSGHFAADGVSFDTSGTNNITTFLSPTGNNDTKGNLWEATRFAITPLRHFLSEIPYDTTGQRDIYSFNGGRIPITPDVGNIHTALNMGPPFGMPAFPPNNNVSSTANGSAGIMHQMGIYNNAFMEQAANMASTSANAFTIHIVAQAIKNTGSVRMVGGAPDVGNSGPGYMNTDDQVIAEQWAQIVVERVPQTTTTGDLLRTSSGAPNNEYKILYYRILDNAK